MINKVDSTGSKTGTIVGSGIAAGAIGAGVGALSAPVKKEFTLKNLLTADEAKFGEITKKAAESSNSEVKEANTIIKNTKTAYQKAVNNIEPTVKKIFGETKVIEKAGIKELSKHYLGEEINLARLKRSVSFLKKEKESLSSISVVQDSAKKITEKKPVAVIAFDTKAQKFIAEADKVKGQKYTDAIISKNTEGKIRIFLNGEKIALNELETELKEVTKDYKKRNDLYQKLGGEKLKENFEMTKTEVQTMLEKEAEGIAKKAEGAFAKIKNTLPKAKGKWAAIIGGGSLVAGSAIAWLTTKAPSDSQKA